MDSIYRFSPIKDSDQLFEAITYIHFTCYDLCFKTFDKYYPNAGDIAVFSHYDDEYEFLTRIREGLTIEKDNWNNKYFRLIEPIVISAKGVIPKATYTHLYIRQPDPSIYQVGDIDLVLSPKEYLELKDSVKKDTYSGMTVSGYPNFEMVKLVDKKSDVFCCLSTHKMTDEDK